MCRLEPPEVDSEHPQASCDRSRASRSCIHRRRAYGQQLRLPCSLLLLPQWEVEIRLEIDHISEEELLPSLSGRTPWKQSSNESACDSQELTVFWERGVGPLKRVTCERKGSIVEVIAIMPKPHYQLVWRPLKTASQATGHLMRGGRRIGAP